MPHFGITNLSFSGKPTHCIKNFFFDDRGKRRFVKEGRFEILVMKDGYVVEHGDSEQIFKKPQHPYTQELLGAVPMLGTSAKRVLAKDGGKQPVLKLDDVTIAYPKRGRVPEFVAVKNFNLEIYPGEIVGLVGESGSGKTTVGRAVS